MSSGGPAPSTVPPAGGSGPSSGATPSGAPSGATPTSSGSGGESDLIVNEKAFASDPAWPPDLVLDRSKSNWDEWDRRLNLVVD